MKKTALFFLLLFPLLTFSQDFFREAFDSGKNYILLANPTVDNIETVDFLVKSKLLKLNLKRQFLLEFTMKSNNMISGKQQNLSKKIICHNSDCMNSEGI